MKLRHCLACLALLCLLGPLSAMAQDQVESVIPADPDLTFAMDGADTLRSNLWVAEALLGEAVQTIMAELPPAPAVGVLGPASSGQGVNLHMSRPPEFAMYAGGPFPHTNCWVGRLTRCTGTARYVALVK